MRNELISIIVPIYNSEKYLKKSIESILKQTYKNIEIIIVNDGSTDKSESIIQEFLAIDSRIRYYKNTNHGVSYTRNFGISKATGDYIMFVDSDDVINENMCEILVRNLIDNDADLSVCNYQIIPRQEDIPSEVLENVQIYTDTKFICLFNTYKGFLCNKLYKKSIIDKYNIALNKEIFMCEDLQFNFEYLKHANKVVYNKAKLYGYLIHNNNASKTISDKWFSILKVYKNLYFQLSEYDLCTQNIIMLNFLYTLFEARVRCEILKMSFESICKNYDIDYKCLLSSYYSRIMKDSCINFKQKIKLFLFYKMYWLAKKIKRKKILGK